MTRQDEQRELQQGRQNVHVLRCHVMSMVYTVCGRQDRAFKQGPAMPSGTALTVKRRREEGLSWKHHRPGIEGANLERARRAGPYLITDRRKRMCVN